MAFVLELTVKDLSDFTGRSTSSFPPSVETSLGQAGLLFRLATCLTEVPTDPDDLELVRNAILSLADELSLALKFAQVRATPFSSETIGSYSYSKAAQKIQQGLPLGISWFDLAVSRLGVCDSGIGSGPVDSGSITVFDLRCPPPLLDDGAVRLQDPSA